MMTTETKPPARAETGAMQFGDDWPGVFIRGDNAAYYAMQLQAVLDAAEDAVRDVLAVAVLRGLVSELAGCRVTSAGTPIDTQRMRPFAEATAGADDALRADHAATARVVAAARTAIAAFDALLTSERQGAAGDALAALRVAEGRADSALRAALAALDARDGAAPHPVLGADCPHCGHDTREGAHRALCPHAPRDGAR